MRVCPKCQRDRLVNHGSAAGRPKKCCQQCGFPFTRTTPRGKPFTQKMVDRLAPWDVKLYCSERQTSTKA